MRSRIDLAGAGGAFRRVWELLSPLPGGRCLFSRLLGLVNPYTGSIRATILELEPGHARARLRDRRRVRNHLRSVHALALMNLAEVTSGLAFMVGLPPGARGIPVGLSIAYHHKARGTITAECRCTPPASSERQEVEIATTLRDEAGREVATAKARWLVGPMGVGA